MPICREAADGLLIERKARRFFYLHIPLLLYYNLTII